MTPISTRHTTLLIALLLPVAAVVLAQSYWVRPVDDCLLPFAWQDADRIPGSSGAAQDPDRVTGPILQWTEGEVPTAPEEVKALEFRIIRSSSPKDLYQAPQSFLREDIQSMRTELHWVDAGEQKLPVHVAYGHTELEIQMGYQLFVYAGRPVETPYFAELLASPAALIGGRRPLTLVSISGAAQAPFFVATDEQAKQWIAKAFAYYQEVCTQ
jgi:hypothetical protein